MAKVFIKNYGCQMNIYDTDKLVAILSLKGYEETPNVRDANLVVLNTCHVREKAVTKLYSDLGRINILKQSINPEMQIAVIGCVAQIQGKKLQKKFPFVNYVLGTQAIQKLPELASKKNAEQKNFTSTDFATDEKFKLLNINHVAPNKISAFVTIQEGCDNFCTYCSVPQSRGRECSRPFHDIINEVKFLAEQGVQEVMLLGQNVNSYKYTLDGKKLYLENIFEAIDAINSIKRIRYLSPNPQNMRNDLIEAHKHIEKLMPFVHLPLQSGSNRILKLMNRPYSTDEYMKIVQKFRDARPDILFSTDLIVGFPSETDQDFEDTLKMVDFMQYSNGFYFKYSPRPHTIAAAMADQVEEKVKSERFQILHERMTHYKLQSNAAFVGKTLNVLFENQGKVLEHITGKSEHFQNVFVKKADQKNIGQTKKVLIKAYNSSALEGEIID